MSEADGVGVVLGTCAADVVELAALRGRARELESLAIERGAQLAPFGGCTLMQGQISLAIRPQRWLLLTAPVAAAPAASLWQGACSGIGAAVDLSSALTVFHLAGSAARAVLARGCRLDLHPDVFPCWRAAATPIAQVAVILASLASGWLLLAPATTARHFHEWLASAAQPFGLRSTQHSSLETLVLGGAAAAARAVRMSP